MSTVMVVYWRQLKLPQILPCMPHAAQHAVNPFRQACSYYHVSCSNRTLPLSSPVIPNPLFVPLHLRPYVHPPFRPIYLNSSAPDPTPADDTKASGPSAEEVEKITAR